MVYNRYRRTVNNAYHSFIYYVWTDTCLLDNLDGFRQIFVIVPHSVFNNMKAKENALSLLR